MGLDLFYTNKGMADGHQNRCIECTKKKSKERLDRINLDPVLAEKEKARHREKYHRLGQPKRSTLSRKEALSKYKKTFPEKVYTHNNTSHMRAKIPGNHLHHWSYNKEHVKDIIELTPSQHAFIHRYMIYDQERMMYRRCDTMVLLYDRETHELFINEILKPTGE